MKEEVNGKNEESKLRADDTWGDGISMVDSEMVSYETSTMLDISVNKNEGTEDSKKTIKNEKSPNKPEIESLHNNIENHSIKVENDRPEPIADIIFHPPMTGFSDNLPDDPLKISRVDELANNSMEESFVRESVIIFDQIPSNQKPQEDDFATEIVDRYKGKKMRERLVDDVDEESKYSGLKSPKTQKSIKNLRDYPSKSQKSSTSKEDQETKKPTNQKSTKLEDYFIKKPKKIDENLENYQDIAKSRKLSSSSSDDFDKSIIKSPKKLSKVEKGSKKLNSGSKKSATSDKKSRKLSESSNSSSSKNQSNNSRHKKHPITRPNTARPKRGSQKLMKEPVTFPRLVGGAVYQPQVSVPYKHKELIVRYLKMQNCKEKNYSIVDHVSLYDFLESKPVLK